MAEKQSTNGKDHDPIGAFREMRDNYLDAWAKSMVETVNTDFAVFSKSGTPLYGPIPLNTLWGGFGGGCQVENDGDPVVAYDEKTVEAGGTWSIPTGTPHFVRGGTDGAVVLDIFAPTREEWKHLDAIAPASPNWP